MVLAHWLGSSKFWIQAPCSSRESGRDTPFYTAIQRAVNATHRVGNIKCTLSFNWFTIWRWALRCGASILGQSKLSSPNPIFLDRTQERNVSYAGIEFDPIPALCCVTTAFQNVTLMTLATQRWLQRHIVNQALDNQKSTGLHVVKFFKVTGYTYMNI